MHRRGAATLRAIRTQVPRHNALTNEVLAGTDSNGRSCHIASYDYKRCYNFKWQVAGRIGRLPQRPGKEVACRKLAYGWILRQYSENMITYAALLF
jgi:hypothetical protein